MKADEIVLIGVKWSVMAYRRDTGQRLWATHLGSGLGDGFVSLVADDRRVYVHTRGKLHCLDLLSGRKLWKDDLAGYGYGLASLALPGSQSATTAAVFEKKRQDETAAAASAGAS